MTKAIFLERLVEGLRGLPQEDIDRVAEYYAELLADRIEEGEGEEAAVAAMPPIAEIRAQTLGEIPLTRLVGEKLKGKRSLRAWEILLLALGSPVWISLSAAAFSIALTFYVVLWVPVIVSASLAAAGIGVFVGGLCAGVVTLFVGKFGAAMLTLGTALVGGGASVFLCIATKWTAKSMAILTKKIALGVKRSFVKGNKA